MRILKMYLIASLKIFGSVMLVSLLSCIENSPNEIKSNWEKQSSVTKNFISSLTWTGQEFVAVGDTGLVMTSKDGIQWEIQFSGVSGWLNSVVWANNKLVAVGHTSQGFVGYPLDTANDKSIIITSPDGISWTRQAAKTGLVLKSVTSTGSLIVAVGSQADLSPNGKYPSGSILISTDGVVWSQAYSAGYGFYSITWTGTQLVAVGYSGAVATSSDGLKWDWQNSNTRASLQAVAWGNNQLIAIGNSSNEDIVIVSNDGKTWKVQDSISNSFVRSVTWSNKEFVAVGEGEFYSSNGENWKAKYSDDNYTLNCVIAVGNQRVAAGGIITKDAKVVDAIILTAQ